MSLSITSFAFDQASYTPGEAINLTVTYSSTDEATAEAVTSAVTVVLSDADGSASQTSDGSSDFPDLTTSTPGGPMATTVTASDNRTPAGAWELVSNSFAAGTTSPFTGTAVLSSTA